MRLVAWKRSHNDVSACTVDDAAVVQQNRISTVTAVADDVAQHVVFAGLAARASQHLTSASIPIMSDPLTREASQKGAGTHLEPDG